MKPPNKDIFWYLEKVGGMEMYEFPTHDDARAFGSAIREIEGDKIQVEIGLTSVRIKLIEQESLSK